MKKENTPTLYLNVNSVNAGNQTSFWYMSAPDLLNDPVRGKITSCIEKWFELQNPELTSW